MIAAKYPRLFFLLVAASFSLGARAQSDVDLTTCTPVGNSKFQIQLLNMGSSSIDTRYIEAFEKAAERWQKVIVGDLLPDFDGGEVDDWFGGQFLEPYQGSVDDLVIGYEIGEIDGVGGTLGSAGPVFVRRDRSNRPMGTISGIMRFDIQDFNRMPDGDIKAVILHEMGHVFG